MKAFYDYGLPGCLSVRDVPVPVANLVDEIQWSAVLTVSENSSAVLGSVPAFSDGHS